MDFNTLMCLALKSQMWPQPLILRTISRPFTKFYINKIEWKIPWITYINLIYTVICASLAISIYIKIYVYAMHRLRDLFEQFC